MAPVGTSPSDDHNRGKVWALDKELDEPISEAGELQGMQSEKTYTVTTYLQLAFQSLGVVFGDLGTSPLYVFYNTFPHRAADPEEVIGALSLIIYSLTLITLVKYVYIVLRASDNGQGGTFALYSLLCRHANVRTIPNHDESDEKLTTYINSPFTENSFAAKTKKQLEKSAAGKGLLLTVVLIGSCMVIGEGILTPAISVLSAARGIKKGDYHHEYTNTVVVLFAIAIIVGIFFIQRFGTEKVSWLFAPIVFLWLLLIGGIGIFNLYIYDSSVLKAFSPVHIYRYFKRGGQRSWASLGGIVLSITGTEALFADLSNFPLASIQIAFTVIVFPCLLSAYTGQAAYLMKNPSRAENIFYRSIPDVTYWPVFAVATGAAIVASQGAISATFSLVKQALALGCFPRVKVVHTSRTSLNQIYIPEINWLLMVLCVSVTAGFSDYSQIASASGTAVAIVMLVTTFLMIFITLLVWRWHWFFTLSFSVISFIVEGTYMTAVLLKVSQGSWVPLVIAAFFLIVMYAWHYGTMKCYESEMQNKVSMAWLLGLGKSLGLVRVPGIGLVYTELTSGVPHIFSHFITNVPAIHSVVIFVTVKFIPVYSVPDEERFLVRRIGPNNLYMYRCVARYGYKDLKRDDDFEEKLFDSIFCLIQLESLMDGCSISDCNSIGQSEESLESLSLSGGVNSTLSNKITVVTSSNSNSPHAYLLNSNGGLGRLVTQDSSETKSDELEYIKKNKEAGVVHIMGNSIVKARKGSKLLKKVAIDYIYALLAKICRDNSAMFNIPHESLLNVGQIFYI